MSHDSAYIRHLEQAKPRGRHRLAAAGPGQEAGTREWLLHGTELPFGVTRGFWDQTQAVLHLIWMH